MNLSDCKQVVQAAISPMRHAMSLQSWRVTVNYIRFSGDDGTLAQVHADHRYMRATIDIDYDRHESAAEVLRSLRHELLHLFHADFGLYREVVGKAAESDVFETMEPIHNAACERTVAALERMLDFCGMTPQALVKIGKRKSDG